MSMEAFEARALELLALKEGWDSYRSAPIEPAVIERARALWPEVVELVAPFEVSLIPINDGGVRIEWEGGAVEFAPEGGCDLYLDVLPDWVVPLTIRRALEA